ncbi:GGDEF domain-containing protein [Variovorax sp. NFACC27]|uniref:GGDEF domain-containing protein n=1 Tax=unclassified Variovorax TaxID=663243 RepID=UPI00089B5F65|nr:diguanylate cyclase (GGDEF) domain-containing protein [Variovorax sp. NFACC28]SEG99197.1 diguanylate cyclase (GGDEF) domain-containing protein [Variovorax sp. NFACC29]SFE19102.1 diguanylate cyclase (GGDEF) domain-containing protein [Variovorax sp. NFACC26]SFH24834.1 diguanylate cyclase (GGDEF) domain-containing protein [Variovorax sp. NFACC27]
MPFTKNQSLDEWVLMLEAIYGGSQNYAKTPYEIHAHLTEVCGVFAKHLFKRRDLARAAQFLPKIFAWMTALVCKVRSTPGSLEKLVLKKFPTVCPYCLKKPCACWTGEKPTLIEEQLGEMYFHHAKGIRRVNDFQLMFREIYEDSWHKGLDPATHWEEICRGLFIRMIEEVAEVGEAIRFHHLYPDNFDNEMSDLIAWWFALVSSLPAVGEAKLVLAEDLLWSAYPGHCPDCQLVPCLCRPGPVRQLMSRPIPGDGHRFDSLTSLLNQGAYKQDIERIGNGELVLKYPSACVRIDVDHFKQVNDNYGHAAGDEALRHIASVIRKTVREQDRVYRISGDEFGVMCANYTEEEAAGAMRRICAELASAPVRWTDQTSKTQEFTVSISVGVSEVALPGKISAAFEAADQASYASKDAGRGTVRRASLLPIDAPPEQPS